MGHNQKMKLKERFDKTYWKGLIYSSLAIICLYPLIPLMQVGRVDAIGWLLCVPFAFVGTFTFSAPIVLMGSEE